jgi:hypothetical protein
MKAFGIEGAIVPGHEFASVVAATGPDAIAGSAALDPQAEEARPYRR